jgi:hypothetical protein
MKMHGGSGGTAPRTNPGTHTYWQLQTYKQFAKVWPTSKRSGPY